MISPETIERGVAVLRAGYADGQSDHLVVEAVYAALVPGDIVGRDGAQCMVLPPEIWRPMYAAAKPEEPTP